MSGEQQELNYIPVRGFRCPKMPWFNEKNMEDAMDFVPDESDLILASYPKTGTTWLQYIIMQIRSKGEFFPTLDDATFKIAPFIEMTGTKAVEVLENPRFYKHHIAYNFMQKNAKSKTIYVYRNPEDTVVSFFHFIQNFEPDNPLDFDLFCENFVTGNVAYGNYFEHLLSFYEHRADDNLLLVSYEKLHANRKEGILQIAKFIDEKYYQSLVDDEKLLNKIIEQTTFDYMKKNLYLTHPGASKTESGEKPKVNFFRKGIVGDGKAALTDEQRKRIKEAAEKVLKGTSIINEWYSE